MAKSYGEARLNQLMYCTGSAVNLIRLSFDIAIDDQLLLSSQLTTDHMTSKLALFGVIVHYT